MKKNVYLFELDSIRSTDSEMITAHRALYDEIVGNGNTVILTFNQLLDSRAFLSVISNNEYFDILLYFFECGIIKVSQYNEVRTTSQFILNSIKTNLRKNKDAFIYSALPVKSNQKFLLKLMQRSLENADLSELNTYIDGSRSDNEVLTLFQEVNVDNKVAETVYDIKTARLELEWLKRFLLLILKISPTVSAYNPPKAYGSPTAPKYLSFTDFYHVINTLKLKKIFRLWDKSIEKLNMVEQLLRNPKEMKKWLKNSQAELDDEEIKIDNRSTWHKILHMLNKRTNSEEKAVFQFAQAIIDACYNYTCEASIYGVSKHYEIDSFYAGDYSSFRADFINRLKTDWNEAMDADKKYLQQEINAFVPIDMKKLPDWKRAVRIISNTPKERQNGVPVYENSYSKQRKRQKSRIIRNAVKAVLFSLVYILLAILIEAALSFTQNIIGMVFNYIINIILFLIIGELLSNFIPSFPNISKSSQALIKSISDVIYIMFRHKKSAYVNKQYLDIDKFESLNMTAGKAAKSDAMKEYLTLWRDRPELFIPSNTVSIVDPRNSGGFEAISKYETVYHKTIGVNYKSAYNMLVVDLIDKGDGTYYPYERLVPTVQQGAVVVLTKLGEHFVLLKQFRHALRSSQLSFPRGFGEPCNDGKPLPAAENILKEIHEELEADIDGKPEFLGTTVADSGISGNFVSVYAVALRNFKEKIGYEGITHVILKNERELNESISKGEINDGFTLAAYALYQQSKSFK